MHRPALGRPRSSVPAPGQVAPACGPGGGRRSYRRLWVDSCGRGTGSVCLLLGKMVVDAVVMLAGAGDVLSAEWGGHSAHLGLVSRHHPESPKMSRSLVYCTPRPLPPWSLLLRTAAPLPLPTLVRPTLTRLALPTAKPAKQRMGCCGWVRAVGWLARISRGGTGGQRGVVREHLVPRGDHIRERRLDAAGRDAYVAALIPAAEERPPDMKGVECKCVWEWK